MKTTRLLAAAVAALCFAAPAFAASLTLTDIDGDWSSSSPTVEGLGTSEIRWGEPAVRRQSGYNFTSSATPFTVQDQSRFVVGEFVHDNFPVFGPFLQSANLRVQFSIVGVDRPITSTFQFFHNETLNDPSGDRCPNGEMNGTGLNVSGCADSVTATLNREQSESFVIDGVTYVLDILGFQSEGETLTNFWTQENLSNSAELVAIFRVLDGEPVPEIPLPASGVLLLISLTALGLTRRRA